MRVKPITTERSYDRALRRIEELWGARHGSPEEDELDILITLVENYEREHYPIEATKRNNVTAQNPCPKRLSGR